MGIENDAMLSFLEDNARFADLFNWFCFNGKQIVHPQELKEASEVYTPGPDRKDRPRIRDIKKRLESDIYLKVLALEAQSEVNYCMPWRIMEYDCREYGRQVQRIQRINQSAEALGEKVYTNTGERLGRYRREDRITPVYTICLYHGVRKWDEPRCLRDMMNFCADRSGTEKQTWESCFADYPMRLICVSEPIDCSGLRTSLGDVFTLLPLRKDRQRLKKLIEGNPAYQRLDEETARTVSVLMGVGGFMKQQEKYKNKEGYNMCQAIREMIEEGQKKGELQKLISQVRKKAARHLTADEAARMLEDDIFIITRIYNVLEEHPEWSDEQICHALGFSL